MDEKVLRDYLRRTLNWHEAHVDWMKAVAGIPEKLRGKRPKGADHSPWELLEHMRIATWDILRILPRRKACVAGMAGGILAEETGAAGCRRVGQKRAGFAKRPGGDGQAGDQIRRRTCWHRFRTVRAKRFCAKCC